jgi:hypothetical protein
MKVEHTGGVKALTDEQLDVEIAALQEMIAGKRAISGEGGRCESGNRRTAVD